TRIVDRRRQQTRQRQLAATLVRQAPARHGAGDGDRRLRAAMRNRLHALVAVERDIAAALAAADEGHHLLALAVVDQPEGVTADAYHVRQHHAHGGGGVDRGFDRGTAFLEHIKGGSRGKVVGGGDHALFGLADRARATWAGPGLL